MFIKKCYLFAVASVFRVKQFTAESRNFLKDVRKSQMLPGQVALLRLRQKQLCSGWKSSWFRRPGKAVGQVYQCWRRIC
jgi:hypothetical protein